VRFGAALLVLVLLIAVVPRLLELQTWMLVQAMRELGPISGWRCAETPTYVYDPNHEWPDSTLLAMPPEAAVYQQIPGVEVDSVEVDLRGGDAVVSTHLAGPDMAGDRLVYVVSPGRLQAVTLELGSTRATICNSRLSDWKIIGEQHLS
jgi:hypothetical protein